MGLLLLFPVRPFEISLLEEGPFAALVLLEYASLFAVSVLEGFGMIPLVLKMSFPFPDTPPYPLTVLLAKRSIGGKNALSFPKPPWNMPALIYLY